MKISKISMNPALQTVLEGKLLERLSTTRKIPLTVHFLSDADVDFGTKSSLPLPYLMCVFSVLQTDGFYLKCSFSKELHVWILQPHCSANMSGFAQHKHTSSPNSDTAHLPRFTSFSPSCQLLPAARVFACVFLY